MPDLPTVEVPFPVTAPHRVVPGPRPLGAAPHVVLDAAWPHAARRRLERLCGDRDGVVVRDPLDRDDDGVRAAVEAAWRLLPDGVGALPLLGLTRAGDVLVETGASRLPDVTAHLLSADDPLVDGWPLACSDDLVVLHRTGPGALRAELLLVAFPSGWPPRYRGGAGLAELHAPVADSERLRAAAPALAEALLTKGPFLQHVWGLDPTGRLDRDPSAPDASADDAPADPLDWWLRVERQTTLPLPHLGRALFLIRPYLQPLRALTVRRRRTLAGALQSLSPQGVAYKGLTGVRDDLVAALSSPRGRPRTGAQ